MYKLVIADDEERIRAGLKKFMNWASLGFECIADFEDGAEVIQYLRHHDVDVVLTDIRMAQISGIEIARYVYEQHPRIKVVINSGYAQFEYAKRAIEYKVEHYLIKPTNIEETKQVFLNIRDALTAERKQADSVANARARILESEGYANIQRYYPMMMTGMREGNQNAVNGLFNEFLDEIILWKPEMLHLFVIDLFTSIGNAFNSSGIDLFKLTGGRFDYRKLSAKQNASEIRTMVSQVLGETVMCLAGPAINNASFILGTAQSYMEANYNKDISLEDVANSVFVSPAYFSRLYKQQTGETFIEYLTRLRLNKAVELLKQHKHKMYEISEMVGYKSSKYFNRQFKQSLGYTPKEYARIVLKVSDPADG